MIAGTDTTYLEPAIGQSTIAAGVEARPLRSKGVIGMTCLIIAESAIFIIFVVAYLYYLGKDLSGPTPRQVLELPILNSICLLSSSATITFALSSLRNNNSKRFKFWWLVTIALGAYFLLGTAREWHHLIHDLGLTIQTNLFGTTFYALVGLHASHVVAGLFALSIVMAFAIAGSATKACRTCACAGPLLAFRGRGLGCRIYRRVHCRSLTTRGFA